MSGINEIREKALKAVDKRPALGPDVNLSLFDSAPVPHSYLADDDLCKLPGEEQQRLIMADRKTPP